MGRGLGGATEQDRAVLGAYLYPFDNLAHILRACHKHVLYLSTWARLLSLGFRSGVRGGQSECSSQAYWIGLQKKSDIEW